MKMEIPESIQAVLRCRECDELLSCGPVFLVHETSEAICGRCSQHLQEQQENSPSKPKIQDRSRNIQYEMAAKLLSFPCRYSNLGCHEKLDFSVDEPNIHERSCKFRNFFCPIVSPDSCNWVGSCLKLGKHCLDVHPINFFQKNPFQLPRPNLSKSNLSNYLVSAFNLLFLLHVKVCVTSGKLFHSMRLFGDSELLEKFSYTLEIEGNESNVTKKGSVLRAGILHLQEPTANSILIKNLLGVLDCKYNESKFTITIKTFCLNCPKIVSGSRFCEECRGMLIKCELSKNGCSYVDVCQNKCNKHATFYCDYKTKCSYCGMSIVAGSFIEHFGSSTSCRKTIQSNIDSVVRVINNDNTYNYILTSSNNIGTIIGVYIFSNSNFELWLHISRPLYELKNFKCSVELIDPKTKHVEMLTPQIEYNDSYDWYIKEDMVNFPSSKNIGIDIKININEM